MTTSPAYDTLEAVEALSTLDPEFEVLARTFQAPPAGSPPPQNAPSGLDLIGAIRQKHLEAATHTMKAGAQNSGLEELEINLPMRDGYSSRALLFKPSASVPTNSTASSPAAGPETQSWPLVILLYGGGFVSGSAEQLVPYARGIAKLCDAVTVCLSYRLAPENSFPTAPNDVWDSVQWLRTNAATFNVDLRKGFVIGGGSAGANLACVTAHRAVTEALNPPFTGVWACIPALLTDKTVPDEHRHLYVSRQQNATVPGDFLDETAVQICMQAYQPNETSSEYTPFCNMNSFAHMPRTYVQVAGFDPLRDDGLIYERALRANGVDTRLDVYPGVPHGFFERPELTQSKRFNVDLYKAIGWLLRKEIDERAIDELLSMPGHAVGHDGSG